MQRKKMIFWIAGILFVLGGAVFVNFIPTFRLETSGMRQLSGNWVTVCYEQEEAAAQDVFAFADAGTQEIARKLGFDEKQDVRIYIYDDQKTMQRKKYGFFAPLLGLDWYIGDNIGTNVILTSPANPGPVHEYENNKEASLHEVTHAYISCMNPRIHLWLTEGTALYLTNGQPFYREYIDYMGIPSYEDTRTRNPIRFADCGGYTFSQTYIEYIDKTYGWDKVVELIRTEDYAACFGKTQRDLYDEWVEYIMHSEQ